MTLTLLHSVILAALIFAWPPERHHNVPSTVGHVGCGGKCQHR